MIARLAAAAVFLVGMLDVVPALAQPGGYYDDRDDRRGDSIQCESRDYRFTRCRTDWRDARLVRQTSGSQCVRGRTWGVDRTGLWVDAGCAGVFVEARGGYGDGRPGNGGWRPGPGWDQDIRVRCASNDYHYNLCQVDVGRGGRVYIERPISNTQCIEGRNWGYNRAGVWVDGGCEAVFVVERRWR